MDKKNLRRLTITVTAQTAYHLREKAGSDDRRALGRVVDELTREHQTAGAPIKPPRINPTPDMLQRMQRNENKRMRGKYHGMA